jgi:capsular polysaccharide biosynthesis protein
MFTKKIILFAVITIFTINVKSQPANAAEQLADKIAKKMKDTLNLTGQQKHQIYDVNMSLHNQKQAARLLYTSHDSLTRAIQHIERTRDSLYLPILGQEKYQLYLPKKRNLVNNN